MGQGSESESPQASSSAITLDSLFDIKGPVRLVPQGVSQKPHLVLRRERSSKNADKNSCLAGSTRFSLVANKRFTISKGHTLSLGIADPTHEDELKLLGSDASFFLEFDIGNKVQMVDSLASIPARMRKSMTGTKTYDVFAERQGPNSLGFPGYPLNIPETRVFASASVQTDSVEHVEIAVSPSTRTSPPTSPKTHKQKSPLRLYPSPISADDLFLEDALVDTCHSREDDSDIEERSFSSMDLSTPSHSLSNSPVIRSPSRPGDDRPLIPGPSDEDCFPIPPATPEVNTAMLEDSGTCSVLARAQAIKSDEINPSRTEPNSCSIVHAVPQLKSKEPKADSLSPALPQADGAPRITPVVTTPPPATPISDCGANVGNKDGIPTMPREMSQRAVLTKSLPQTKPQLTPTPQPTISNPLGIRPSANVSSKPPPTGPRSLLGGTNAATAQTRVAQPTMPTVSASTGLMATRKPVVIGAKWTALRGSSSSSSSQANANSAASTVTPSPAIAAAFTTTPMTKTTTPANTSSVSIEAKSKEALSQLLRSSVSQGGSSSTTPSTSKRKLTTENDGLIGQGSLLTRVHSANGGGDNKGEMKERTQTREDTEDQPRKKMKIENVEGDSLSPTSTSSLQATSSVALSLISRVENTSADGSVDGVVPKTKSQRRRERQKMSKKRKAELEQMVVEDKLKREETKQKEEQEEKARLEKVAELAQEKLEADNQKLAAATPISLLPVQKQTPSLAPPRVVHPLPPKPQIAITSSSYRPGRQRDRRGSRASSRSGGSLSRSRSPSRGREATQARRIRSPNRSRSRKRDSPVDHQQWDKQTKRSTSAGNPSNAHEDVGQCEEEAHTPDDARGPGTTPVRTQSKAAVVNGNATLPTTIPSRECKILDWEGKQVAVQHLVFSSDGKRLAVACSDMVVRIWETNPAKEVLRWQTHTSVVSICWLQYDDGVLVLFSDGSTDTWTPNLGVWQWKTLFDVPLSGQSEKPLSLAYRKDKIAVSTTVCVKVWLLTAKGMWQPQREIKRSGVTALRFQTDGSGLFGGCRDGTLWYCEVPNGTLRAYAFLPSNQCITCIHLHPGGTQLLIGQKGGTAYLISHQATENKGTVERKYSAKSDGEGEGTYTTIFATRGQAVVNGISNGSAVVWDRKKGNMVYGLKHGADEAILAIAAFDGRPGVEGMMVSGTGEGKLCWWPIPQAAIR